MEKIILVTVSDDRSGRKGGKYSETQDKIKNFFTENTNFGITDFSFWKWKDIIKTQFYIDNREMLDQVDPSMNGRCYKPFCVSEALKLINDGDFLIYNDCSPEMWEIIENPSFDTSLYNINVLKKLCSDNGGILTAECVWSFEDENGLLTPNLHTHENFTLDRCMKKMFMSDYRLHLQHAGGLIILQKNSESISFANEWLLWNLDPECASLGPINGQHTYWHSETRNGIGKIGHRHDQSISGLLIAKMGKKLLRGLKTFCFLECCLNKNYDFVETSQSISRYKYVYDHVNRKILKKIRR